MWLEVAVVILGLLYIILIAMELRIGWIVGTIGSLLFVISNIQQKLYMDTILNSYYVLAGIYGWFVWGRDNGNSGLEVLNIGRRPFLLLLAICIVITIGYGFLFNSYKHPVSPSLLSDSLPYLDAFVTTLSFLATWMAAKKYIENWLVWLVADPLAIILYSLKSYPVPNWWLYPALFLIYSFMAAYGYYQWKKDLRPHA